VQFQGNQLDLDHGSLQVDTVRERKVLLGCVTASALTSDQTQFNVIDVDGKVKVVVSNNDVEIHLHGAVGGSKPASSSDAMVREGEQATRQDRCGGPIKPVEGLDAKAAILNSP
jgi:ferric-dicitrate binding protein FerR (iron transport regulator)